MDSIDDRSLTVNHYDPALWTVLRRGGTWVVLNGPGYVIHEASTEAAVNTWRAEMTSRYDDAKREGAARRG
jgi:hypothetical protein